MQEGEKELRIADDVIFSPTYAKDMIIKLKELIETNAKYGIYHMANSGKPSLYDIVNYIVDCMNVDVNVVRTSIKEFYPTIKRNTYYPMTSEKIGNMRNWKDAVKEYVEIAILK